MRQAMIRSLMASAFGLCIGGAAFGCAFHGYTPNPTLVDQLLATEQVAVARPSGGQYTSAKALLGADPQIGLPVSAAMRGAPAVLLARDGAYGPWVELAVLDSRFQRLIEQVLDRQSAWQLGQDADRARLFAAHLTDPSPAIRRLALQELDRADYGTLKALRLPRLDGLLTDTGEPDLRPIRVLLAGLSGRRDLRAPLAEALHRAVYSDVAYLGAYATAMIELDRRGGLPLILAYLSDATLPLDRREKLLDALALHYKTGAAPLRRQIATQTAALTRANPDLRAAAARQFGLDGFWR